MEFDLFSQNVGFQNKRSTKYQKKLTLVNMDDQLVVDYATCIPCPARTNGGPCQHIFALLLVLKRYSPKPTESDSSLPGPQSCTSEKKSWGPRKRDVTPKTMMSTTVEHAKESSKCKKLPRKCTLYEARSDKAKNMIEADVLTYKRLLHSDSRLFSVLRTRRFC